MVTTYTLLSARSARLAQDALAGQGWPVRIIGRTTGDARQEYLLITEAPDGVALAVVPGGLPMGRRSKHGCYVQDVSRWQKGEWL